MGRAQALAAEIKNRVHIFGQREREEVRNRKITVANSNVIVYEAKKPLGVGKVSGIHKYNLLIEDASDPFGFIHYLPFFYHPDNFAANWPILIFIPGLLCNGNHPRIVPHGGDYKDLNVTASLLNTLVMHGCRVVLVNSRNSKWINKRYVENKLGVRNSFPAEGIAFDRMSDDLDFYYDVVPSLLADAPLSQGNRAEQKVVAWPFSYGCVKQGNNFVRNGVHTNLVGNIPCGMPISLDSEEYVMGLAQWAAGIFPAWTGIQPLYLLGDKLPFFKPAMKRIPKAVAKRMELIRNTFCLDNTNPQAIFDVMSYVLESAGANTIDCFIRWIEDSKGISDFTNGKGFLQQLAENDAVRSLPTLVVSGKKDRLAPEKDGRMLSEGLGAEWFPLDNTGHVDMLAGENFIKVATRMLAFMSQHYGPPVHLS